MISQLRSASIYDRNLFPRCIITNEVILDKQK